MDIIFKSYGIFCSELIKCAQKVNDLECFLCANCPDIIIITHEMTNCVPKSDLLHQLINFNTSLWGDFSPFLMV